MQHINWTVALVIYKVLSLCSTFEDVIQSGEATQLKV